MNNNNKGVKIGNENFKEWLRSMDANTRVRHMSDIVKTLSKMGLRGSEIKAALAQLSQRCQVMLVRLTDNQIKHYTRRKPLQKLQYLNPVSSYDHHEGNHPTSMTLKTVDESSSGKEIAFSSQNCGKRILEHASPKESSVILTGTPKQIDSNRSKFVDTARKKQKKKELLRELFGEDDAEDVTSTVLQDTQKTSNESSDKEVNNYLSTTVNVNYYNIYNGTPSSVLTSNSTATKRKIHTENTLIKSSSHTEKRLRIDVSLANNQSPGIKNKRIEELVHDPRLVETQKSERKKSSNKHLKRKCSAGKKKPKKDRKKSSKYCVATANVNGTEEDPSIKELWSILGMESPTDRTAKFLSDRLNFSSSETVTLHAATEETNSTDKSVNVPQLKNNACINTIDAMKDTGTESPVIPTVITQSGSTLDEEEPCIQISEAFSLAEMNTQDSNNVHDTASNPSRDIAETMVATTSNEGETFTDSNKEQQTSHSKQLRDDTSKIGTIRVKSLGLLIDPKLQSTTSGNIVSPDENLLSSTDALPIADMSDQSHRSSDAIEESFEERFFATYVHYFDELVEAKIPKLGELLHLGISDAIRWEERIKRADQLSSTDLIDEEKIRAAKDLSEMMRLRGVEFAPLCDIIVKRFDLGSKVTLFYALFFRILKHAGTIDPGHEKQIVKAKRVITLMLKKHQYKDKDILEELQSNDADFEDQAIKVGQLVAKCTRPNDNAATAATPLASSCKNVTSKAPPISEVSQGRDNPEVSQGANNPNYQTIRISEESYLRLQQMLSTGRVNSSNNGQSKTDAFLKQPQNSDQNNTFQNTPININVPMYQPNIPKRLIPTERQQPLTHHQSNLTTGNRMSHQETSHINGVNATPQAVIINYLQNALEKKGVNTINCVNNPNIIRNVSNSTPRQHQNVRSSNISLGQNRYALLKHQLSNKKIPTTSQQFNAAFLRSQVNHALPVTSAIAGIPPQAAAITLSNSTCRVSTVKTAHNFTLLSSTAATSTANIVNTLQLVTSSSRPQVTSTVTSANAQSILSGVSPSVALPGGATISVGQQQRTNVLNTPVLQHPRPEVLNTKVFKQSRPVVLNTPVLQQHTLDQAISAAPINVRSVVDPAIPALVAMDPNQLRMPTLRADRISSTSSEPIADGRSTLPPITPTLQTASSSSPPASASPEVTSPTEELNLPSSSHCHPFIARRPISGKMKMLFGNSSNG